MVRLFEGAAPLASAAAQNDLHLLQEKRQLGGRSGAGVHLILA